MLQGSIHLGLFIPSEISSHFRGDVTYCPEDDIHFPTLTVQQTLSFAATTRTPRTLAECPTPQKFRNQFVDILQNMLGLSHTRNTVVGNEALRGVSGERKNESVSEKCWLFVQFWGVGTVRRGIGFVYCVGVAATFSNGDVVTESG
ncbi:hypothetical protein D9758_015453 [Tetrapyrgos nigripes]|uniref:Uncharacterized protein n=1 Tax=Tetrapyrgos nigripes TaxID=182062 RepID=A0A8H5CKS6_9AGAR|nr:hypothetical protein D9758_015453 [Tetrapyrgos nigripes]